MATNFRIYVNTSHLLAIGNSGSFQFYKISDRNNLLMKLLVKSFWGFVFAHMLPIALTTQLSAQSECFAGSAARSGTFKRPLLDVNGKRYELKPSATAEENVKAFLDKFSKGDRGKYLVTGAKGVVNGREGIVVDKIKAITSLQGAIKASKESGGKNQTAEPKLVIVKPSKKDGSANADVGRAVNAKSGIEIVRSFPANKGPGWKQSIDIAGAVGPDHVVDFDVANFVVHDKKSGKILKRLSTEAFWIQVEPAGSLVPNRVANDARIIYDPLSKRWFACAAGAPEADCFLAVSTSPDPTKPWRGTKLPLPRINPYMKMGVDRNGLYICSCNGGADPRKAMNCYVIPKKDALARGGPVLTNATNFPALQFSSMPALDFDPNKPADAPTVLLTNEFNGVCDQLYMYKISWTGLKARLSDLQIIPLKNTYQTPNNSSGLMEAVQPDPGPNLHAGGGGRRLDSVFVRNGSVFGCNGAKRTKDSRLGVLWYEVRISDGKLIQEGFVDSPDRDYLYPSIAVDASGNVGIGCTGTSKAEFPSVYVMMRSKQDPAGLMREPVRVVEGTTCYHYAGKRAVNWSHYSATCIDPSNPDLLWTVQGYGNSKVDREWCTAWAGFRLAKE